MTKHGESNFGIEAPFALGVEEELLLVDEQGQLLEQAKRVVWGADPDQGEVVGELFKGMVGIELGRIGERGRGDRPWSRSGPS